MQKKSRKKIRLFVVRLAIIVSTLFFPILALAEEPEIKILIIVEDSNDDLNVRISGKGDVATGLLAGPIVGAVVQHNRNQKFEPILNQHLKDYDRETVIYQAFSKAISVRYPFFKGVHGDANFLRGNKVNFKKVKSEGYRYVMRVKDQFSGIMTLGKKPLEPRKVVSVVNYKVSMYDAKKGKRIWKGRANTNTLQVEDVEQAVSSDQYIKSTYPNVALAAGNIITGQLLKNDILHQMASVIGKGDSVPQLGQVLKRYKNKFKYSFSLPKGWKKTKFNSKYVIALEPKNEDKMKFGIRYEVDLLLSELGQAVDSEQQYANIILTRMQDAGYEVLHEKAPQLLGENSQYLSFLLERPGAQGKEVFLINKVDDTYAEIFIVVFLDEYEKLLEKYSQDIATVITGKKLKLKE